MVLRQAVEKIGKAPGIYFVNCRNSYTIKKKLVVNQIDEYIYDSNYDEL